HERLERAVTFGLEEALVTNALEHAASGEAALREVLLEPAQECLRVVQRGDACLDGLGLLWGTQGGAGAARTGRLEIARRGFRGLFGRMVRRPRGRTPDLARGRASRACAAFRRSGGRPRRLSSGRDRAPARGRHRRTPCRGTLGHGIALVQVRLASLVYSRASNPIPAHDSEPRSER